MKNFVCMVGLLLAAGGFARAQEGDYFSVLSNNTDKNQEFLFVEVMYTAPICAEGEARFFMTQDGMADSTAVPVDTVLNNQGTYTLSADKKRLSRPKASGYRMRFQIPAGFEANKNPRICIRSYTSVYQCVGCAAGGSNAFFALPESNKCPAGTYTGNDLLACYQRGSSNSKAANYEAWIRDGRDCGVYRIVKMPDGKWWFAQNLALTKELNNNLNSDAGSAPYLGSYWCPGGASAVAMLPTADTLATKGNVTATTAGDLACKTFGALYTWNVATAMDGRGAADLTRGICPDGWRMPTLAEFDALFTAVKTDSLSRRLKSTLSCPPHASKVDSACVTNVKAAWAWRRADVSGKVTSPYALATDMYGFSALPAGYRLGDGANFTAMGYGVYWWANDGSAAAVRGIDFKTQGAAPFTLSGTPALSVRCVK